ncbi:hypothetical protein ACFU9Y_03895 [Streptomyces sp. NPDC057621]|uniref:hypothetical protein n=1 Tax=Streptomyces sp. NPDC057621 TaxID=3346186 RepID=UPI0036CA2EA3
MTEDRTDPWVGDQVWDEDAGKEGVVTDVKGVTYILRPPIKAYGGTWEARDSTTLTITVTREERLRQRNEVL